MGEKLEPSKMNTCMEKIKTRRSALKVFMEEKLRDPEMRDKLSVRNIEAMLRESPHEYLRVSATTINRDLLELGYEKTPEQIYQLADVSEEKDKRRAAIISDNKELLAYFVQDIISDRIYWLTLRVTPGYADGVAKSFKKTYSKKIFGIVPADNMVMIAFENKQALEYVKKDLKKITEPSE